jgi:N-glycosylase/DNA lyase
VRLVNRLEADDFNCLKGVKIAPMYARIIDDEVCDLHNIWELDIPVDTHIRRLSRDLFNSENEFFRVGKEVNDDEIRFVWRELAKEHDISRHIVDGGLWLIGNNWDSWGKEYWEEITSN